MISDLSYSSTRPTQHLIDCNANPYVPKGWKVDEHQKGGAFPWDASNVELYLDPGQQGSNYIQGNELRTRLVGKPVLNANVLDYLLANPHLIPYEWKMDESGNIRYIFFWGTVYRSSGGRLLVRCLCWDGGRWDWNSLGLVRFWDIDFPAALRVS
jgi:hypothetical protein